MRTVHVTILIWSLSTFRDLDSNLVYEKKDKVKKQKIKIEKLQVEKRNNEEANEPINGRKYDSNKDKIYYLWQFLMYTS